MGFTPFPHGISVFGAPILPTTLPNVVCGNVYWVGSTAGLNWAAGDNSTATAGDYKTPFATLDYAIGRCTASNGDVIYLLPGHAESIIGATSLTMDVAGVSVIGLGTGSLKPTFTFSTAAAATWNITAANCLVQNVRCYSSYTNGVTTGFTIGASADGLVLRDIEMEEGANTTEFLIGMTIAAACHRVTIDGLDFYGVAGGTDSQCIIFSGASNHSIVRNCRLYGDWSEGAIDALTAASINMLIENNVVYQLDGTKGLTIGVKSDTTGVYKNNCCYGANDGAGACVGNAMAQFDNDKTNSLTASGFISPAIDS